MPPYSSKKINPQYWKKTISIITESVKGPLPSVSLIEQMAPSPFRVLISTIISLRTKDEVTYHSSLRLFAKANTPEEISALSTEEIATLIYPAGFYNTKAKNIKEICQILIDQYGSKVPRDSEKLMALPGVGLKTTNLVLSVGMGIPAICVDIHVHRIANRMGWVNTSTPDKTEEKLRKILPREYWIAINEILVLYGQQICKPISPYCSVCKLKDLCPQKGVSKHR